LLNRRGAVRIEADDQLIWLIGDPHLGRRFETGVPLHRRGERERLQLERFEQELNMPGTDLVVIVGDVFDHPHVSYGVVLKTFELLQTASNRIVVMTGNHDEPRKRDVVSAIDLLDTLCFNLEHVELVRHNPAQIEGLALFPWSWTETAEEQVAAFQQQGEIFACVGHWDLVDYGGDTSHMAPTKAIRDMVSSNCPIISGHYHVEGDFEVDGVTVTCTGSMEPYSHGEDPEGERYLTFTLAELEANTRDLTDMCVRVLLDEGEELPIDLNCLALTGKRQRAADIELEEIDTNDFSWKDILESSLKDVTPHVREFITDKLKEFEE
jgi:DNA repair exonuclease SbcCD nuclease subunit